MAHKAVRMEPDEFLKEFLDSKNDQCSHWDYNVFKDIEGAKKMTEAQVQDKFVSRTIICLCSRSTTFC